MCGICGIFNYGNHAPVDPSQIEAMKGTIVHRGPDDEGTFIDGSLGLGFRRLSIIDLSPAGHQPMTNADRSVWVIFNGEIYNFQELRTELEARGCVFKSHSDTEVIVHGYHTWGLDILQRLNGMFGLGIWDAARRRLVLARDRAGIKLVYYKLTRDSLLFGSEVRPILAGSAETPALDPVALQLFLRYRYAPSPYTLFSGIRKLPPGSMMIVEGGRTEIRPYWRFSPRHPDRAPSAADAEHELLELYRKSVRRQLVSDVPVGLLLSGGIDSAMLLALMRQEPGERKTFTVGYGLDSDPDDELEDAAHTARVLNAPHCTTRIDQKAFESSLSGITRILEEPVATASIVPMYFVCERARKDVTVALIGQGPDELFGGYKRHLGIHVGAHWRSVPSFIRGPVRGILRNIPRSEMLKRGLASLETEPRLRRMQDVFSLLPGEQVDRMFKGGLLPADIDSKIFECWDGLLPQLDGLDELSAFNYLEVCSSLPDELLMYADKLSMHHSLELRVPYLDHEVIEYAIQLPQSYKVRCLQRKWLHRRACRALVPDEILRRRKRGFSSTVIDGWFRASVGGRISDLLADPKSLMYQYLEFNVVSKMAEDHRVGRANYYKSLFCLVFLEEWLRNFTRA